jgi:hypothetical protein
MERVAYRFVPDSPDGRYRETSRYLIISTSRLEVGSEVTFALHGHSIWEVVQLESATGPLTEAMSAGGDDIPLAGTVICRGIR